MLHRFLPALSTPAHGFYRYLVIGFLALMTLCCLGLTTPAAQAAPSTQAASASADNDNGESYQALANALDNPKTRDALVAHLRQMARQEKGDSDQAATGKSEGKGTETEDDSGFAITTQVADITELIGNKVGAEFHKAADRLKALSEGRGMRSVTTAQWIRAIEHLVAIIVVLVVAIKLLHRVGRLLYRKVNDWAFSHVKPLDQEPTRKGRKRRDYAALKALYGRMGAVLGTLLIDIFFVMVAAGLGYGVGVLMAHGNTDLKRLASFFVNAFVTVEVSKALVRTLYAKRYPSLRLIAVDDKAASYWTLVLCRLIAVTGYGLMVVVPLVRLMFSPAAGQTVNLVVMLGVYIYALKVILNNRRQVSQRFKERAQSAELAPAARFGWMLARSWHIFAILYMTVLLVISQLAPDRALSFMGWATVQTGVTVFVGLMLSSLVTVVLGRHYTLSEGWQKRLPKLEKRLNAYAPMILFLLRLVIAVLGLLFILDGWHVILLPSVIKAAYQSTVIGAICHVLVVLLIALAIWVLLASMIEHRLSNSSTNLSNAREQTLLALLRNAMLVTIVIIATLVALSQIGINIGPLLASAGVLGLAVSFGAQKLVADIITGVFIQFENGMNQGDVIETNGVFGTVERLTIRSVGVRTMDGAYHLISYSTVTNLTNHMRDFSYHLGEYTIGHRENVDDAMDKLRDAFDDLMTDPILAPEVMDNDFSIPGVVNIDQTGVTLRVLIKTTPGMQWAVQRGYNRLVKAHFDAANIEMPYPQTVLHFGEDKNGNAAPMRLVRGEARTHSRGGALAPGQTPRRVRPNQHSEDVLGNEHETGEQGRPSEQAEEDARDDSDSTEGAADSQDRQPNAKGGGKTGKGNS